MQLSSLQSRRVNDLHDPARGVVPENSHGQNVFAWKAFYDVGYSLGRYLARRRGEDKPDGIGSHGDRQQGVVLGSRPTDLYDHGFLPLN